MIANRSENSLSVKQLQGTDPNASTEKKTSPNKPKSTEKPTGQGNPAPKPVSPASKPPKPVASPSSTQVTKVPPKKQKSKAKT